MAIEKTEGIVIKRQDFRETSIIATFFTKEFGKVKGLLKGARSDWGKFGSRIELFSNNDIVFYRKTRGEMHLVSQCDLKEDFLKLRKDYHKVNLASYILRLVDFVMAPEDKNEKVFNLMLDFLRSTEEKKDISLLEKFFEIKLLSLSGFKPFLDACIVCSKKVNKRGRFSLKLGGLICENCFGQDLDASNITEGTIASLIHLEKNPWQQSVRLKLSKALNEELGIILRSFLNYHTGINFSRSENNYFVQKGVRA